MPPGCGCRGDVSRVLYAEPPEPPPLLLLLGVMFGGRVEEAVVGGSYCGGGSLGLVVIPGSPGLLP